MAFEYFDSKEGVKTVKANGLFLHSSYAPLKEAERFVQSQKPPFEPEYIVITEPALSYCVPYLRKKFSNAKIGAIRYCTEFSNQDSDFDFVFTSNNVINLKNTLLNYFTEENLFSVFFISWPASEKAFSEENKIAWNQIKEALYTAKTLLITRQFFEKKWLINTANFVKYANNFYALKKSNSPVFVAASGPSLKDILPLLKTIQSKFIIIALSSAISVLLHNGITPDFCINTDGGYWAGEHLKKLLDTSLPLALSCEAYCKKSILQNSKIIPLNYSDGMSLELCKNTNIPFIKASRNGTVSGTALELALNLTDSKVYFTGLDLCSQNGFQHTQPNELEINTSITDNKLSSKEKRLARASFKNESLEIYEEWFKKQELSEGKVFRIISSELKKNSLGMIKDISPDDFEKASTAYKNKKDFDLEKTATISNEEKSETLNKLYDLIVQKSQTEEWKKTIFPLDYVTLKHNPSNQESKQKLEKENSRLVKKLQKILKDE